MIGLTYRDLKGNKIGLSVYDYDGIEIVNIFDKSRSKDFAYRRKKDEFLIIIGAHERIFDISVEKNKVIISFVTSDEKIPLLTLNKFGLIISLLELESKINEITFGKSDTDLCFSIRPYEG